MPTELKSANKKAETSVRFLGFSDSLMVFSDSRLIVTIREPREDEIRRDEKNRDS